MAIPLVLVVAWLLPVVLAASLTQVNNFGNNPGSLQMYIYVPNTLASNPAVIVAVRSEMRYPQNIHILDERRLKIIDAPLRWKRYRVLWDVRLPLSSRSIWIYPHLPERNTGLQLLRRLQLRISHTQWR